MAFVYGVVLGILGMEENGKGDGDFEKTAGKKFNVKRIRMCCYEIFITMMYITMSLLVLVVLICTTIIFTWGICEWWFYKRHEGGHSEDGEVSI